MFIENNLTSSLVSVSRTAWMDGQPVSELNKNGRRNFHICLTVRSHFSLYVIYMTTGSSIRKKSYPTSRLDVAGFPALEVALPPVTVRVLCLVELLLLSCLGVLRNLPSWREESVSWCLDSSLDPSFLSVNPKGNWLLWCDIFKLDCEESFWFALRFVVWSLFERSVAFCLPPVWVPWPSHLCISPIVNAAKTKIHEPSMFRGRTANKWAEYPCVRVCSC